MVFRYFVSSPSLSILVNATSGVKLYQFAKVFWDYTDSAEQGQGDASEKSAASLRKLPFTSDQKIHDSNNKKPERDELLHHACFPSAPTKRRAQGR